jgi:hypothetical protein
LHYQQSLVTLKRDIRRHKLQRTGAPSLQLAFLVLYSLFERQTDPLQVEVQVKILLLARKLSLLESTPKKAVVVRIREMSLQKNTK